MGHREAMVAVETNGTWSPASEVELPANAASNPTAYLRSACLLGGWLVCRVGRIQRRLD